MDTKSYIPFVRETFKSKEFISLHSPLFIGKEKELLNDCIDPDFVPNVGCFVDNDTRGISPKAVKYFLEEFAEIREYVKLIKLKFL